MNKNDISRMLNLAQGNVRNRVRFCTHADKNEVIQEMYIIHPRHAYVRPHLHVNKPESMLVLEGEVDFITFATNGSISDIIRMGDYNSGDPFYNSMRDATYHTLLIRSEWLAFLEFTQGPFRREDTIFAPWSPEESDMNGVSQFMEKLKREVDR